MDWKVRHAGSPRSIDNLTFPQVVEGLQDGLWEPSDEVQGPQDSTWVPIESHPQLEEAASEIEPPPPRVYDDETRLDFNPLIDVCLVLLVFFILTTSYAVLQKQLELPNLTSGQPGPAVVTKEEVKEQMIHAVVKMENGKAVVLVEDKPVPLELGALVGELSKYVRQKKTTRLLLEHDAEVPLGDVVVVQDAAKGAGMERVHLLVPDNELPK
jgi:biopolymer transport protein ExbD